MNGNDKRFLICLERDRYYSKKIHSFSQWKTKLGCLTKKNHSMFDLTVLGMTCRIFTVLTNDVVNTLTVQHKHTHTRTSTHTQARTIRMRCECIEDIKVHMAKRAYISNLNHNCDVIQTALVPFIICHRFYDICERQLHTAPVNCESTRFHWRKNQSNIFN